MRRDYYRGSQDSLSMKGRKCWAFKGEILSFMDIFCWFLLVSVTFCCKLLVLKGSGSFFEWNFYDILVEKSFQTRETSASNE